MQPARLVLLPLASVLVLACGGDGNDVDAVTADAAQLDDASPADAEPPPDADPPDASPLLACAAPILPGADHTQLVFDRLLVPASAVQSYQLGLNIDGDPLGRFDNALGQILATLASQGGLDFQAVVDGAVASGQITHLLSIDTATPAALLLLGVDCNGTPTDNFSGDALLAVDPDAPVHSPLPAIYESSALDAGPGKATVDLPLVSSTPIRLPLVGVRITGTVTGGAVTDGKLGGAITQADIDGTLIPGLADAWQELIDATCSGSPPSCCPDGSTGQGLLDLFDTDGDCQITLTEVQNNDLIASLLAPDVDLFDEVGDFNPRTDGVKDSLSLGLGFTAVGARFELPE